MRLAATVLALSPVALAGCAAGVPPPPDGLATVVEVVDGDTVDVEIGGRTERVRLTGIDTPETKRPDTPIECYGPEASAFTARMLPPGTAVRVQRDVVGRDDYGRLLGYVHLVDQHGRPTTFVNLEIVEQGFAVPLTIEPNSTFSREFADAARRAERADLGLWRVCSP